MLCTAFQSTVNRSPVGPDWGVSPGDDPAAAAVVELVRDLSRRIAGKERPLTERLRELGECDRDCFVELADRLV
jgi:hypothetical protein